MKELIVLIALFASTLAQTQNSSNSETCIRCVIVAATTEGALKACPNHIKIRDEDSRKTYETFKKTSESENYQKMADSITQYYSAPDKCHELAIEVRAANNGTGGSIGRNYALISPR